MSEKEIATLKDFYTMCSNSRCVDCPLNSCSTGTDYLCTEYLLEHFEDAERRVLDWRHQFEKIKRKWESVDYTFSDEFQTLVKAMRTARELNDKKEAKEE